MKININSSSNISDDMTKGIWFLAYRNDDNHVVMVQRPYWSVQGINDPVVYLHEYHMGYDLYETFRRDYTIIKKVEEITVE